MQLLATTAGRTKSAEFLLCARCAGAEGAEGEEEGGTTSPPPPPLEIFDNGEGGGGRGGGKVGNGAEREPEVARSMGLLGSRSTGTLSCMYTSSSQVRTRTVP